MMKHISLFRVKPEHRNPETLEALAAHLRAVPQAVPSIVESEVGLKPFPMPTASPDGNVQFFDLVQIISFRTPEDCMAYPASQGHLSLLAASSPYMEQVVGIDYEVE